MRNILIGNRALPSRRPVVVRRLDVWRGVALVWMSFAAHLAAQVTTIYIDAYDQPASNAWNKVNFSSAGTYSNLVDSTAAVIPVWVEVTTACQGLNSSSANPPTGDAAEFAPAGPNQCYGSTTPSVAKVRGLAPGCIYSFTFYGSCVGVNDNRDTRFQAAGVNGGTNILAVANNTSEVAVVPQICPTAAGEITITIDQGPANTAGYFYFMGMKIEGFLAEETLTIAGIPANIGDPDPCYGTYGGVANGSNLTMSVASGKGMIDVSDTQRACCTGYVWYAVTTNTLEKTPVAAAPETTFGYTHSNMAEIAWIWRVDNRTVVTAGVGGSVTAGGVSGSVLTNWGDSVTGRLDIVAVPTEGRVFHKWTGDIDDADSRSAAVTVDYSRARTIAANFGSIHFVDQNSASPESPFNTWETAAHTIADAYAVSVDGDEIVLAEGTYTPADTVTVVKGVTIRSGSGVRESVIVTGAGTRRPFILDHADAKLISISVQNGKADTGSYTVGSNIRINANGGTVSNCVVRGGIFSTYAVRGSGGGAGISCASANGLIVSCVVTNNALLGNSGIQQGGGLYLTAGKAVNCFIAKNKALLVSNSSSYGGGVFMNGTAKLVNCSVVDNMGTYCGGVDAYGADVAIVNCLIWGNSGDGATDVCLGHTECFDNCVARYPINASCFGPGTSATTGPFYTPTPAFAGIDNSKTVAGVTLPATDILGNPRFVGAAADVGCVEYQATAPDVAFSVSESSGFAPLSVTFTAHTSGMSGIASYNWDFDGDGSVDETTTEPGVTHSYAVGYATPKLTVTYSGQDYTYSAPANAIKSYPQTMYVDGSNDNPVAPYGTKATAANTIGAALSAAMDGQEIVVMTNGSPYVITAPLEITKAVTLRGETGSPEDVVVKRTSGSTKLTRIANAGAFVHSMVFHGGYDTAYGIGIRIESAGGTVSNCVIRSCVVNGYWSSAAVYAAGADARVTHCVITNNTTETNSNGDQKTAGLHLAGGAVAANCLVANNRERATSGTCCTGGAYVQDGYIYNCTIVDNTARQCGGIRIAAGGTYNCVIAGNTATISGSDYNNIYAASQKSFFHYCACNDAEALNETCQQGTAASFFSNYASADYTVGTGSKLIDNGISAGIVMEGTDLVGGTRVMGEEIDIGCYEFDTSAFTGGMFADVTQGIVPITVNFTASVSGTNGTDQLRFIWDYDGDDAYDETTDVPTVSHSYTKGGNYTVNLKIENVTAVKETVVSKSGMLYFCAEKMYVVNVANANAAFPYDGWETASTSVKTAVDAALDGVEIILTNGTHNVTEQIDVAKVLDIRGLSGDPADTIVLRTSGQDTEPGYKLNNAAAKVRDITWDGGATVLRPGWYLEKGGMITNCVLTRFKNFTYWASAGAVTIGGNGLVTHCVITNNTQTYLGDSGKAIVRVSSGRIENSLIAYNTDSVGVPIAVVAGKMLNCTIVTNEIKSGTYHLRTTGTITNSIVMCNTVGGAAGTVMSIQAGKSGHNIADVAAEGFACDTAANVFDKSARVLPWTISLEAARKYRGDKSVASPEVDLAGNPRRILGRLDPGCYQCQGTIGFHFIMR